VKRWELIDRTQAPDGSEVTLSRHDEEYLIVASGQNLMSSRMHGSEEELATLGCERARTLARPWVLVGGLGMGFTLRATLNLLPRGATVVVAELLPAVVEWNRGPLGPLAEHPLNDPRVRVDVGDVAATLRASPGRFDAVLIDIDNGPSALTAVGNVGLYDDRGVALARAALRSPGTLAVWSSAEDRLFERRLRQAGLDVEVARVRGRMKKGPRHTIFLGHSGGRPRASNASPTKR